MAWQIAAADSPRLIRILFAVQFISMGAMEMSGPFWPLHLKSLGGAGWLFGLAGVGVYVGPMLGMMLTSAFWGRIGDRYGHKPMMIRALLGLALTQLALACAGDAWSILALRFVQGACAGYIAPAQAYGVAIVSAERRARLFACLQVSTNVGALAGALAGGLILDHASFFWINVVAAVLCALCAVAVLALLPGLRPAGGQAPAPSSMAAAGTGGRADDGTDDGTDAGPLWQSPAIAGVLGVLGLLLASRMVTQMPFALYVSTVFRADNWTVGLCYGLLALGFVASASLWARYFEHKSVPDALRRIGTIAAACACLTAAAGFTRHIGVFVMLYFAWGTLLGATTPVLMALVSKLAGRYRQGYVLGVAQSTAQFSSIAGTVAGGWFSQSMGLQSTYFWVAGSYVLAWLAVRVLCRSNAAWGQPDMVAQQ
ncbi:MAG TPA: MFS transporter [Burkholderiaceae bacterium]|nr:MFS transporter [Burkholderiaceae bacterium]